MGVETGKHAAYRSLQQLLVLHLFHVVLLYLAEDLAKGAQVVQWQGGGGIVDRLALGQHAAADAKGDANEDAGAEGQRIT